MALFAPLRYPCHSGTGLRGPDVNHWSLEPRHCILLPSCTPGPGPPQILTWPIPLTAMLRAVGARPHLIDQAQRLRNSTRRPRVTAACAANARTPSFPYGIRNRLTFLQAIHTKTYAQPPGPSTPSTILPLPSSNFEMARFNRQSRNRKDSASTHRKWRPRCRTKTQQTTLDPRSTFATDIHHRMSAGDPVESRTTQWDILAPAAKDPLAGDLA